MKTKGSSLCSQQLTTVLSQINPVHVLLSDLFRIHFIVMFPPVLMSS
jgi:hypothetical protein